MKRREFITLLGGAASSDRVPVIQANRLAPKSRPLENTSPVPIATTIAPGDGVMPS